MTNDILPPHLEAIGRQLTAAAHDLASSPRRARRLSPRLLAASTTGLAAIAAAAVLAIGASTATPPAFAVTRHQDGSVSLKINRRTSIAAVNRRLTAMGIERISRRARAAGEDLSSIPNCSAIPAGWKGEWVQMAGSSSGPGYSIEETVPAGTWVLLYCSATRASPAGSSTTADPGTRTTNAG
ncbi:MAG TPA: hypothetical protein VMF14_06630 [Solirubrobacteraceae bacterium]|nr:hypothetical protein [Solirubrobacteraceae bacterium]